MNPDGIHDDNHYSTLNDLLTLSLEVVDNMFMKFAIEQNDGNWAMTK